MVTFAQNFEDVMLSRAFSKGQGFYVDVGAWDPDIDSVTRHFYDNGWSGINIEPSIRFYEKLTDRRDRDVNLNVAVGSAPGTVMLRDVADFDLSRLSTTCRDVDLGDLGFTEYPVKVMTLDEILRRFVADREVDFLKIDAEGGERDVLLGSNFSAIRPKVIVIEATLPNTSTPCHEQWEDLILDQRYSFAYFDGLNRFYIANECFEDLSQFFKIPPCVHDRFVFPERIELEDLQSRFREVNSELIQMRETLRKSQEDFMETGKHYQEMVEGFRDALTRVSAERDELTSIREQLQSKLTQAKALLDSMAAERREMTGIQEQLRSSVLQAEKDLAVWKAESVRSENENEALRSALVESHRNAQGLAAELDRLKNSKSWKLTKLLRWLFAKLK